MSGRMKFLFPVALVTVLVVSGSVGFVFYKNRLFPQKTLETSPRTFPQIDISKVATHNQNVRTKPDIPPYYAITGIMRQDTGASYTFESLGEDSAEKQFFPLNNLSVRYGPIYREYLGVVQPVSLGDLGREDKIYLTYYTNFEKGLVMGIIKRIDARSGTSVLYLLDDPDDTGYAVSEAMDFAISDPSQYFGYANTDVIQLKEGNILWGEFIPTAGRSSTTIALTKMVLHVPPYRVSRGVVGDIEMTSDRMITFRLDSLPSRVSADTNTIVYKHEQNLPPPGIENYKSRNLGLKAIGDGQEVSVFMFLAGDHWKALSIGIGDKGNR